MVYVQVVLVNTHTSVRTMSEVHNSAPTVLHGETVVVLTVSHHVKLCHDKLAQYTVYMYIICIHVCLYPSTLLHDYTYIYCCLF